ncbi:lytic transglycosylase domain-containing protein [Sphingomonas koreensis]|nr:lytic transglycosylase domain-containing protein [Sphingomonas koreensis]
MSVNPITTSTGSIQAAIQSAAAKTGIDFNYLLGQAQVESGMRADARARTSSASGLYQFIDQSWLSVVKQHGAANGLSWAANAITTNASGHLSVSDPATRQAILQMRNDPTVASLMAAEHAADNKAQLEGSLGRAATGTDLYMAHFLGLGGARSFLKTMSTSPTTSGAALFPAAARANRNVFYEKNGQPRTLAAIYGSFSSRLDRGAAAVGGSVAASDVMQASATNPLAAIAMADGATVIPGAGQSAGDATDWAQATLDQINGATRATTTTASMMRPTPATARLAYLMLASLGA